MSIFQMRGVLRSYICHLNHDSMAHCKCVLMIKFTATIKCVQNLIYIYMASCKSSSLQVETTDLTEKYITLKHFTDISLKSHCRLIQTGAQ